MPDVDLYRGQLRGAAMSEVTILPEPVLNVTPPPVTKWEKEYQAFLRLLPELLKTHRGKYVAIHDEQVIESGDDRLEVIFRALGKAGGVSIHVDLVSEQPPPPIRIPHYRVVRRS
jgi:hypothetical protein